MRNRLFSKIPDTIFKENCDLTKMTYMNLVSRGDLLIIQSKDALKEYLKMSAKQSKKFRLLGSGANQLLEEEVKDLCVKLELPLDKEIINNYADSYRLPASISLASLTSAAVKNGLDGFEVFTGIPSSLGGAIAMNAGTNLGEIGELISEVSYINRHGQEIIHQVKDGDFVYRGNCFLEDGDVVYEAVVCPSGKNPKIKDKINDYLKLRNKTQPMNKKTCGCVFKNYSDLYRAGRLVDNLGLKGLEYKELKVSQVHGNFIENRGGATLSSFKYLVEMIRSEVLLNTGIRLETEVKYPKGES